jgi:phage protein D
MGTAIPYYQGQNFFAPRFEIRLQGQNLGNAVIRDVLEVTYKDDLANLDSVEFTLNDWDPVTRQPRYSSPYDANNQIKRIDDTHDVPSFEPGARIELSIGYYGAEEPRLMMVGQIVSITPNFPASGTPTLRVRALNLLFTLQREQKVMVFENKKDSEIAREIARELEVEIEIPTGQAEAEEPNEYTVINNEYPILYLMNRARRNGYDLFVNLAEGSDTPTLFFGKSTAADMEFSIEWGKSLLQFSPTLKTKEQVSKVTVRGWDPSKTGDDRSIVGEATWADLDIEMPDPQLLANINTALAQSHEEVTDQPILNQQQAEDMAAGILRGIAQGLVTGRGATVGFPELRAGRKVHIEGLGLRYSGIYRITETTHTIGNAGYTTQFSARMEVIGD